MSDPPKTNIQVGIRVRPLLPKYVRYYSIVLRVLYIFSRERANGETEQWLVTPTSITQKDSKLLFTSSSYSFSKLNVKSGLG